MKDLIISKELLSEVLDGDTELLNGKIEQEINSSYIVVGLGIRINIYELAHKCKEWAIKNGYYLTIYNDAIDIVLKTNCKIVENITDGSFNYSPMLVFKACNWILEQNK